MLLIPLLILLLAVVLIFTSITSAFTTLSKGGETVFNSSKIEKYGMDKYAEIYDPTREGYEDNILVVLLVETEDYCDYSFIGIVGNHVNSSVVNLFGNEQTALGRAIYGSMPDNYANSLSLNLKSIISTLTQNVKNTYSSDDFDCNEEHNLSRSKLVNYSAIPIDETTINTVLAKFTEETGITMSFVIDEQVDVYGKTISPGTIIFALMGIALIVVSIVLIVKTVKKNRGNNGGNNNGNNGYNNNGGNNSGGYNNGGYNGGGYNNGYNNGGNNNSGYNSGSGGGRGERININNLF